jgi:phospho-N-acetylmuramoyl-pentapeptide-transferase
MVLEFLSHNIAMSLLESRLFAAGCALIISFFFGMIFFPLFIKYLQKNGFSAELEKNKHQPVQPAGFLFVAIILPVSLLTARYNGIVISALSVYVLYAIIGFVDDLVKIRSKKKIENGIQQKKSYLYKADGISVELRLGLYLIFAFLTSIVAYYFIPDISKNITIPFVSTNKITIDLPIWAFVIITTFGIAIVANGVNFTDGLDTLSTVPLITNFVFVALVAYIASRPTWSEYLRIPLASGASEIIPVVGAVIGILIAYLWFNSSPSSIIMGDSGSIGLGGLLGASFILLKVEFFIPIVALIFILEFISSFLQMFYFKISKGKRLFKCAPIHHHFQFIMREKNSYSKIDDIKAELNDKNDNLWDETLKNIAKKLQNKDINSKITWRFHIVSFILLVITLVLYMKVR